MRTGRFSKQWRLFWPLALLCLISGSRWLLENAVPAAQSSSLSAAGGCALAAMLLLFCLWAKRKHASRTPEACVGRLPWRTVSAGVLVLTAPALSGLLAGRHISGSAGTLALALTPVVAAVAAAACGAENGGVAGLLWPGLAGLAGLLLLLPEPDLSGWRMDAALVAMPLLAGGGAAIVGQNGNTKDHEHAAKGVRLEFWVLQTLGASAIVFLLIHLTTGRGEAWTFPLADLLADGFSFAMSVFVLLRMGPLRWSAQFLLLPLVTLLEGVMFLRPSLTARSWTGLLLIAIGGVYLLVERPND